jgi:hypothetical protein
MHSQLRPHTGGVAAGGDCRQIASLQGGSLQLQSMKDR